MGRAWDHSADHRNLVDSLRARVCSNQSLQPNGRSSQRCLRLQQGKGAMDPGLRQWAQPDKMQDMNSESDPVREPHMAAHGPVPLNNCWQPSRR